MFKVGDWCYYDFDLNLIKEMRGKCVTLVSTGYINTFGNSLDCFPLIVEIKLISENFKSWEDKIRESAKSVNANINWPGLHGRFVTEWIRCCYAQLKHQENLVSKYFDEIECFAKKWIDKLTIESSQEIDGVPIFRR